MSARRLAFGIQIDGSPEKLDLWRRIAEFNGDPRNQHSRTRKVEEDAAHIILLVQFQLMLMTLAPCIPAQLIARTIAHDIKFGLDRYIITHVNANEHDQAVWRDSSDTLIVIRLGCSDAGTQCAVAKGVIQGVCPINDIESQGEGHVLGHEIGVIQF
jgi:hypothetical protein